MYALLNTSHTFLPPLFLLRAKEKKKKKKTADDDDDDDDALGSLFYRVSTDDVDVVASSSATAKTSFQERHGSCGDIQSERHTHRKRRSSRLLPTNANPVVGIHGNLPRSGAIHIRTFTCHENAMETRVHARTEWVSTSYARVRGNLSRHATGGCREMRGTSVGKLYVERRRR